MDYLYSTQAALPSHTEGEGEWDHKDGNTDADFYLATESLDVNDVQLNQCYSTGADYIFYVSGGSCADTPIEELGYAVNNGSAPCGSIELDYKMMHNGEYFDRYVLTLGHWDVPEPWYDVPDSENWKAWGSQ